MDPTNCRGDLMGTKSSKPRTRLQVLRHPYPCCACSVGGGRERCRQGTWEHLGRGNGDENAKKHLATHEASFVRDRQHDPSALRIMSLSSLLPWMATCMRERARSSCLGAGASCHGPSSLMDKLTVQKSALSFIEWARLT